MKKKTLKKSILSFAFFSLCVLLSLTVPFSSAKFFHKEEYSMKLRFIERPLYFHFYPGNSYEFLIPHSGYYAFQLWGGAGGASKRQSLFPSWEEYFEIGGLGGMVTATGYFEKGEILIVTVGTWGGTSGGGYNGGAYGGTDSSLVYNYYGGGGGGATDIRILQGSLADRILVAGGGGGGSGGNIGSIANNYWPNRGGNGGTIESDFHGMSGEGTGSGEGGTQTEGGMGANNGSVGNGGNAQYSGGGGGGGYYGGGGSYGSGGGGGGGSSYIGDRFIVGAASELPGRESGYDARDGYALLSFLGDHAE